jgi:hypothetical protein
MGKNQKAFGIKFLITVMDGVYNGRFVYNENLVQISQ